jgi:acetylglutamate kinase
VDGLRVTDDETMEVVEMVLGGRVNPSIVDLVQRAGGRGLGLTGRDGGMLRVVRKRPGGRDLGRVGEVVGVDSQAIVAATTQGFIPVVAPIGVDADGVSHNVNADEAAGAIAVALKAEKLILLTDVEGVLDARGALISQLSAAEVDKYVREGTIRGGMIPKVECCLRALEGGVARAHVIDGRVLHAVLLEIFTDGGVGTVITGPPREGGTT